MSAEKDAVFDDSAGVSIHYIICECGETFPSENGLRDHLEKEHPHKREKKEFKCGVCGWVYALEEDCITHYEETHMQEEQEYEEEEEEHKPQIEEEVELDQQYVERTVEVKPQVEESQLEYISENGEQYIVQVDLGEDAEYYIQTEEVAHTEEYETEELSHDMSQDISQEETALATQVLVKAEPEVVGNVEANTEPQQRIEYVQQPPKKAPVLRMVRDPETNALVLVYSRSAPHRARTRKAPPAPAGKNIVCETCGKKYASAAALKYHQRSHTGDRPYQCHLCPKAFTMPLFLQIHVRTHTGERPYQCPDCPKAFSNRAALLRHDRVHTGEKPYVCPMCMKSFTQSNSMKLHVTTVHLKQAAPYKSMRRREKARQRDTQPRSHARESMPTAEEIKAFATNTERARYRRNSEMEISQDDEMNCYDVVYEEEIQ